MKPAAMNLSHVGLFVQNVDRMVDFYTRVFGFVLSDRGTLDTGGEIAFLTRNPREHHQLVIASGRPDNLPFNVVQQLSFRVSGLADLRAMQARLRTEPVTMEGPTLGPITHGNAVSLYFRDFEGHRTALFIDTPWYVSQPMRIPIDLSQSDEALWALIEAHARALPGFKPIAQWHAEMAERVERALA
jgi:catechol 2,3-dioxygenase-like lactoylglutathione lyase family enzyme